MAIPLHHKKRVPIPSPTSSQSFSTPGLTVTTAMAGTHSRGFPEEFVPAGGIPKSVFVKDTQVVAPSRMIALGDSQLLWGSPTRLITGSTMLTYVSITERAKWRGFPYEIKATKARHFGRHQIGFCDGHVQSIKYEDLFADSPEARRLCRIDHEPHDPNEGTGNV